MTIDFPCPSPVHHAAETSTISTGKGNEDLITGLMQETQNNGALIFISLSEYNLSCHGKFQYVSSVFLLHGAEP